MGPEFYVCATVEEEALKHGGYKSDTAHTYFLLRAEYLLDRIPRDVFAYMLGELFTDNFDIVKLLKCVDQMKQDRTWELDK